MIQTLREHAYDRIRQLLLTGCLPPGTRLSDLELSKAIGISRTPVREALSRLASEGLVDHRPRSGAFVRMPERRELEELYQIREWVESAAAAEAARQVDGPIRSRLGSFCSQMQQLRDELLESSEEELDEAASHRLMMLDSAFHMCIIQATKNRQLMKMVGDLRLMTRMFGHRRQRHTRTSLPGYCQSHQDIHDAIVRGDADAARREMAGHISRGRDLTLAGFEEWQAKAASEGQMHPDFADSLRRAIRDIESGHRRPRGSWGEQQQQRDLRADSLDWLDGDGSPEPDQPDSF